MEIWNGIESYRGDAPVVASIGNYDGVHLGHAEILRSVVDAARRRGEASLLITFDPHPLSVIAPERMPRLLHTRRQKLEILEDLGLDGLLFCEFNAELAALNGQAFFERFLGDRVRLAALHVGENFRFGRERSGDLELLRRIGEERGFAVRGIPALEVDGRSVSSTLVRKAVESGDVDRARRMLGRPYALCGEVVEGDGRGRSLQCPTANVEVDNELVPAQGVYVTETAVLAGSFPSVTNIGVRPTFGGDPLTVETHLLEFDEDLYHERIEVRFLARLRDEMRFDGVTELADQLARDRAAAQAYFENQPLRTA